MTHSLKRVATPDDWASLHAIRRAELIHPGRHAVAYDENHPDDRAASHLPFLLLDEERVVGTARLDLRGESAVVRLVAITAAEQRRGHGRALSDLIDAEARRRGVRTLLVNAAPDAVGFYEKTGWHPVEWDKAERKGLAADAVQMMKVLPPMPAEARP